MNARAARLWDFDPILLLAALGLVAMGSLLIYSGSLTQFGPPAMSDLSHPVVRQAAFAGAGLLLALALARIDYLVLGTLSLGLYIAAIAGLVFVLAVGETTYGSRRWIEIAGIQVQPSEIAKLVVVIALAKYLADRQEALRRPRVLLLSLAIAAVPAGLVLTQPDLGSAVIFAAVWMGMVIVAGARWRHLLALVTVFAISVPFVLMTMVEDYQRERIRLWLKPESDPTGGGFQAIQNEIAIGSGGFLGKGLTEGTQTQLDYLRTQTSDFVFSVLGEELGFVGALVLFGLFAVLLWRALHVAEISRDPFGRLLATGVAIYILLQAFINVGVNVGLLPVTGIPLPFVSQGGSSLITLLIAIGILESIALRHRKQTFHDLFDT